MRKYNKVILAMGVMLSAYTASAQDFLGLYVDYDQNIFQSIVNGPQYNVPEIFFSPNTATNTAPSTGDISVTVKFSNQQYTGLATNTTPASVDGLAFGVKNNTTQKVMNKMGIYKDLSTIGNPSESYYAPTESMIGTGLIPDTNYAFNMMALAEGLAGLPTEDRYFMGQVTYTFSKPVDNPIIHFSGLGAYLTTDLGDQLPFSAEYELVSSSTGATGLEYLAGTERPEDTYVDVAGSKVFDVADNKVYTTYQFDDIFSTTTPSGTNGDFGGNGSAKVVGNDITEVTFDIYLNGKIDYAEWTSYPGDAFENEVFNGDRHATSWTLPLYDFGGSVVIDFDQNGTPGPDMPIDPNNGGTVVGPYTNLNAGDLYTPLYAVLVDGQGNVAQVSPVSETNGTFDFDGVLGDDYKVLLSTTEPTIGDVAPSSATLGTGWQSTEEQFFPGGAADLNPDSVTEAFNVNASTESQITDNNLILGIKNLNLLVPVELISFEGIANGDDADLTWVTITENNNSHFEIERSFDGANFVKIGEVEGNGTTDVESNYSFTDVGVGEDATVVYYKLKQVDFDGSFEYSKVIVRVEFDANPIETSIYPNPVNQGGDVQVEAQNIETIEVYSVEGQLMNMYEVNGAQVFTINTTDLATGVYFVKVNGLEAMKLIVK